jgi:hypothetical protein
MAYRRGTFLIYVNTASMPNLNWATQWPLRVKPGNPQIERMFSVLRSKARLPG